MVEKNSKSVVPEIRTPFIAVIDLAETFDHLEKNDWEIPDKISVIDSRCTVQSRIDGVFTGFIGYIESAKRGKKYVEDFINKGTISASESIGHVYFLKTQVWNNYENKSESFDEDMDRVKNSLAYFLSADKLEQLYNLEIEFEEPSIEDLKYSKDFFNFLERYTFRRY